MCDLKTKYDQWRGWLFGDDKHAIDNQIRTMIWDCAVFLSINKSREYSPLDDGGKPAENGMVHSFINHCFFVTQSIAIRRLLDRNVSHGERSIISLYRLICDMQRHRRLLTRQGIVGVLGYPYDYRSEENRILQEMADNHQSSFLRMPLEYGNCVFSQHMHEYIDYMADVKPEIRNLDDTVRDSLFEWLKSRLDSCREICGYVDKHFAHSATPESREAIKADEINITLGHILDAHRAICETAHFVMLHFFYRGHGNFLAIPQFDQFEYFDKPLATTDAIGELRKFWNNYEKQTKDFSQWDWKDEYDKHIVGKN